MSKSIEAKPVRDARRDARRLARTTDLTYQQALDHVAREAGHEHWAAMAAAHAAAPAMEDPPSTNPAQERRVRTARLGRDVVTGDIRRRVDGDGIEAAARQVADLSKRVGIPGWALIHVPSLHMLITLVAIEATRAGADGSWGTTVLVAALFAVTVEGSALLGRTPNGMALRGAVGLVLALGTLVMTGTLLASLADAGHTALGVTPGAPRAAVALAAVVAWSFALRWSMWAAVTAGATRGLIDGSDHGRTPRI